MVNKETELVIIKLEAIERGHLQTGAIKIYSGGRKDSMPLPQSYHVPLSHEAQVVENLKPYHTKYFLFPISV